MIGSVVAMEPADYQTWLSGGPVSDSPVAAGEKLFQGLACNTCHMPGGRGPVLTNLFGHEVELQGGGKVVADEAYLRESIVLPQSKVVAGFQPVMPPFQGMVTEEQLLQLIAYLKSLKGAAESPSAPAPQQK